MTRSASGSGPSAYIHICNECGSGGAPTPLFAREDFRAVAGPALRPGGTALTGRALDLCRLPRGALVADIGCGRGASLTLLAGRGYRGVGVDPSPSLLAEARQTCIRELSGTEHPSGLLGGAAEAIPLSAGIASAALCECVLSVTLDPAAALAEMRRILVPGGLLILSDLYLRAPSGPAGQACTAAPGCATDDRPPGCASGAVPRREVESRLEKAGFAIRLFEDHSRLLAELAGRLLFAGLPRSALGGGCSGAGRPGYFLCIAQLEDL